MVGTTLGVRVTVRRLTKHDHAQVERLLEQDRIVNLFLLGMLATRGLQRAHWYGLDDRGEITGVLMVLDGTLAVPWCPRERDATRIGEHINGSHRVRLLVGPRAASDALFATWMPGVRPRVFYDQHLYVYDDVPPPVEVAGFRPGRSDEWRQVARNAALMEQEDLGFNPTDTDPELHARVVRARLADGRTWVVERDQRLVFQINVGTATAEGCQVGGTWVPPEDRGKGLATAGMRALCRALVPRHQFITLHVNEANTPAVRVYEKTGFERYAPFRLIRL